VADFGGSDLDAFRAEARQWFDQNLPASLRKDVEAVTTAAWTGGGRREDFEVWRKAMAAKGWGTPTWPKAYGGGGLTPAQGRVVMEELARIGAPNPMAGMGTSMIGPTLLEYGTEEQKQRHLPPIVRGELRWCQGYSEPNAGSDLASLQTKCVDAGDHWVVNGQKIWTSGAQYADWCFCLVRTDNTKKHEGISFVLIDMRQPGAEARPIRLIYGTSPFCETFFTDARVEKNDMVGPLNGGWTVAKRLMQFERSGGSAPGRTNPGASLGKLAVKYVGLDEDGRLADSELRSRITAYQMEARAFAQTAERLFRETRGGGPTATTSIMKNVGSWVGQARSELMLEIMGHQGLGWEGEDFAESELDAVRTWLFGKATTIFAGSQEVQNNVISKRILGLPDTTQST
jgi:alkylation response protein AidB-like acyl-CoA dehydrogenase